MIDPVLIVALVAIVALTVAPVIQNRRREHKLDAVLASLGEIMANQETLNELAGQLSSAADVARAGAHRRGQRGGVALGLLGRAVGNE